MIGEMWPVDVICLSSTDGKLRPLRIRATQEQGETIVGDVCEILSTRESHVIGAEYLVFLCRIRSAATVSVLELKFFGRSRLWYMSRVCS